MFPEMNGCNYPQAWLLFKRPPSFW